MSSNFRVYGEEAPYYAKFDKEKNYIKVLARGGVALQARELTDMQTYSEYQLAQFASSFFDDGQVTNGGKLSYTKDQTVLKVNLNLSGVDIDNISFDDLDEYMKRYIGLEYTVKVTDSNSGSIIDTGYYIRVNDYFIPPIITYDLSGNPVFSYSTKNYYFAFTYLGVRFKDALSSGNLLFTCTSNSNVSFYAVKSTEEFPNPTNALFVKNTEGSIFVDGFFARVPAASKVLGILNYYTVSDSKQELYTNFLAYPSQEKENILEKYIPYSKVTYTMGFDVSRNIVSANEDPDLCDPAIGTYNYKAPGANRQQLSLELKGYYSFTDSEGHEVSTVPEYKSVVNSSQYYNFLPQIIIKNDVILLDQQNWELKVSTDTLAKRTYEESGNYTVNPWKVTVRDATTKDFDDAEQVIDSDKTIEDYYVVSISPGIGYIYGYRIQNTVSKNIIVEKPRNTILKSSQRVNFSYGQYTFGKVNQTENGDCLSANGVIQINNTPVQLMALDSIATATNGGTSVYYELIPNSFIVDGEKYLYRYTEVDDAKTPLLFKENIQSSSGTSNDYIVYTKLDSSSSLNAICTGNGTGELNLIVTDTVYGAETQIEGILDKVRMCISDFEYESGCFYVYFNNTDYLASLFSNAKKLYQVTGTSSFEMDIEPSSTTNLSTLYGEKEPKIIRTGFNMVSNQDREDGANYSNVKVSFDYTKIVTGTVVKNTTIGNYIQISEVITDKIDNSSIMDIINSTTGEHIGLRYLYCHVDKNTLQIRSSSVSRTLTEGTSYKIVLRVTTTVDTTRKTIKESSDYDVFYLKNITDKGDESEENTIYYEITTDNNIITKCSVLGHQGDTLTLSNYDVCKIKEINVIADGVTTDCSSMSYKLDIGMDEYKYGKSSIKGFIENYLTENLVGTTYSSSNTDITIKASYFYYYHANNKNPFMATSYKNYNITESDAVSSDTLEKYFNTSDRYNIIPKYTASNGTMYELRDCIDFRNNEGLDAVYPNPGSIISFNAYVYLPRIDRVWVDKNGNFGVTTGINAENPSAPSELDGTMTLYLISNNGYVPDVSYVTAKYINNQRYTMNEIGNLDKRITNLEDLVSLSLLEQSAVNMQIIDEDGNNRFKSGIFTDDFTSYNNVNYNDENWSVSIDLTEGSIRPQFIVKKFDLALSEASGTGKIITLEPSGTEVFAQNLAVSNVMNVTDFMFASWNGSLVLSPSVLTWETEGGTTTSTQYEETEKPKDTYNSWTINSLEGITASQGASSISVVDSVVAGDVTSAGYNVYDVRDTTMSNTTNITTTTKAYNIVKSTKYTGSYDLSSDVYTQMEVNDEYIRTDQPISYTLKGMAANMYYAGEIDGVPLTILDDNENQVANPVIDANGSASGRFYIPENVTVGNKSVVFYNTEKGFNCEASTQFTGYGKTIVTNNTKTYIRKWTAETSIDVTSSAANSSTQAYTSTVSSSTSTLSGYVSYDPIAETFSVSSGEYPNGVILESIEVYFSKKPANSTDPSVFLYLSETNNGYPSANVIPFSRVTLTPDEVSLCETDSNGDLTKLVGTKFVFSEPIYLPSNADYAFIIGSGCHDYEVYVSKLGAVDILTREAISVQPFIGSFFQSQNMKTWSANQEYDMTFKIYKNIYSTSTLKKCVFTASSSTPFYYDMQNLSINTLVPANTEIDYRYTFGSDYISSESDNTKTFTSFKNSENVDFNVRKTLDSTSNNEDSNRGKLHAILYLSTTDKNISPMVDSEEAIAILSHNILKYKKSLTGDYISYDDTPLDSNDAYINLLGNTFYKYYCGSYVSNSISLENECNDVRVILDVIKPNNSGIEVYVKIPKYDTNYFIQKRKNESNNKFYFMCEEENVTSCYHKMVNMYYLTLNSNETYTFTAEKSGNTYYSCYFSDYKTKKCEYVTGTGESGVTETKIYIKDCVYDIEESADKTYPFLFVADDVSDSAMGTAINVRVWSKNVTVSEGDYFFHNENLWKCIGTGSGTETLSNQEIQYPTTELPRFWKKIRGTNINSITIQTDSDEWDKMVLNTSDTSVSTTSETSTNKQETSFQEYSYQLEKESETLFSSFALKIDLYSYDEVNVPRVRNLRAIAIL